MLATQVLAHPVFAEQLLNVLSACRHALTSRDYARRLVETIASTTHSQYAVWLNWPDEPESLVAETDGFPFKNRVRALCACVPRLSNDLNPRDGVTSVLAAPILFRSSIAGVLAVGNGARPYTPADLHLLEEASRIAVLEYEALQHTEALGLEGPRQRTANLVHQLRQPLGVLEACAFYLDLIMPPGENKPREQLAQMQKQIHRASGILDASSRTYPPCNVDPPLEEVIEPVADESLVLTNSAMSMVT